MATELRAYIVSPEGEINVVHVFYGANEAECERHMEEHVAGCEFFQAADADGRVYTESEQIDEEHRPDAADFEDEEDGDEEEGEDEDEEV